MTQSRTTTQHLTPAVVSAATGVLLAPLADIFAVIHDLTDGRLSPAEVESAQARIRAELIRQFPWLADLRLPDFDRVPETRAAKGAWIVELTSRYGGMLQVETGTLTDIPGAVLGLPEGVSIVRNA
jgi:hypothetical protein